MVVIQSPVESFEALPSAGLQMAGLSRALNGHRRASNGCNTVQMGGIVIFNLTNIPSHVSLGLANGVNNYLITGHFLGSVRNAASLGMAGSLF